MIAVKESNNYTDKNLGVEGLFAVVETEDATYIGIVTSEEDESLIIDDPDYREHILVNKCDIIDIHQESWLDDIDDLADILDYDDYWLDDTDNILNQIDYDD